VVQIGLQIAKAATQQVERLVVQLEPAELGRVEVRLEFGQESRVSAIIAAERPETLDALQRDVRLLERGLQDSGLRLDNNSLSFSLKHEQSQGDGRQFSEHAADADADAADRTPSHTEDAAASGSAWQSAGLRLLDIQA
jgi:flagellar hook-length control protein FliK